MAEVIQTGQQQGVANEVQNALVTLESLLSQASFAAAVIRNNIAHIATLEQKVHEMEAAVTRALESLAITVDDVRSVATTPAPTPIRPMSPEQPLAMAEPPAAGPEPEEPPAQTDEVAEPAESGFVSHCLRMIVSSTTGSLDLKAVDAAVNESPDIVDVALLDYDGRQATLKLWINQSADAATTRDALLTNLQGRLNQATIGIDFEEASAA